MRVSDGYMYDLANRRLMRSRAESTVVSTQVSSGKRVEAPWDDAAAAGLITRFAQDKVRQVAMQNAADRASEELGAVDSAFQQVVTTLSRAQELAGAAHPGLRRLSAPGSSVVVFQTVDDIPQGSDQA
jgi:flagellin-like hook-associated protein FlgL